jgi:hypothetical protein
MQVEEQYTKIDGCIYRRKDRQTDRQTDRSKGRFIDIDSQTEIQRDR